MIKTLTTVVAIVLAILAAGDSFSQEYDFEQLSLSPKTKTAFALDHKIVRPRLEYPKWDKDFHLYYPFLTPALRKTQATLSGTYEGVTTTITPNSIIPHAQLDTNTMVKDEVAITGLWRMLVFRSVRYVDSLYTWPDTVRYYRLPDVLLGEKHDDGFLVLKDGHFKLYVKEEGKQKFSKKISSKYAIEHKRAIILYKFGKSAGGVSQIGIDESGFLIMNYPKVIENVKRGKYISYHTIIDQYIFERVRE
ncbi:MAG: hypothetical protein V4649_15385 [Bacteroidota bacterium]